MTEKEWYQNEVVQARKKGIFETFSRLNLNITLMLSLLSRIQERVRWKSILQLLYYHLLHLDVGVLDLLFLFILFYFFHYADVCPWFVCLSLSSHFTSLASLFDFLCFYLIGKIKANLGKTRKSQRSRQSFQGELLSLSQNVCLRVKFTSWFFFSSQRRFYTLLLLFHPLPHCRVALTFDV